MSFDFELQAAATDDAIVLSMGTAHSFPLTDAFHFVRSDQLDATLQQAVLQAPMFGTRWRWNASRALAVLRFDRGKKVPPFLQRMRADDLLAAVFPAQVACQDNAPGGPIEVPDQPIVRQTVRDCLREALDTERLRDVLGRMERGEIRLHARDTTEPSPFSHEVLNAKPYAFLDDAPLEERRARAISLRRTLPEHQRDLGALDADAIARVVEEARPQPRDADELHDALMDLVATPLEEGWRPMFDALARAGRAARLGELGFALENARAVEAIYVGAPRRTVPPHVDTPAPSRDDALLALVRGHAEVLGPFTPASLGAKLGLEAWEIDVAVARLESDGLVLRGRFTPGRAEGTGESTEKEACDRRLLARIHRYTLDRLRSEIEPVSAAGLPALPARAPPPHASLAGGRSCGPARRHRDAAGMRDRRGGVGERRPGPARRGLPAGVARRAVPRGRGRVGAAVPEALGDPWRSARRRARRPSRWPRAGISGGCWSRCAVPATPSCRPQALRATRSRRCAREGRSSSTISRQAARLDRGGSDRRALGSRGPRSRHRRRLPAAARSDGARGGRRARRGGPCRVAGRCSSGRASLPVDELADRVAGQLLARYGVVFRELCARESFTVPWRDVLRALRRREARGAVRGGRFVAGFIGEQYALAEAVEGLRRVRREERTGEVVRIAATDPLNLVGILTPGPRIPAHAGVWLELRDGAYVSRRAGRGPQRRASTSPRASHLGHTRPACPRSPIRSHGWASRARSCWWSPRSGGHLAMRFKQPSVLGELLGGILLGSLPLPPSGDAADRSDVDLLARLGVLVLLFEVGLESTVRDVLRVGIAAARGGRPRHAGLSGRRVGCRGARAAPRERGLHCASSRPR